MKQVSFAYDKAVNDSAICGINIRIPKGQTILLCGESGSGKTTFSRLINGLIPAYYEGDLITNWKLPLPVEEGLEDLI